MTLYYMNFYIFLSCHIIFTLFVNVTGEYFSQTEGATAKQSVIGQDSLLHVAAHACLNSQSELFWVSEFNTAIMLNIQIHVEPTYRQ